MRQREKGVPHKVHATCNTQCATLQPHGVPCSMQAVAYAVRHIKSRAKSADTSTCRRNGGNSACGTRSCSRAARGANLACQAAKRNRTVKLSALRSACLLIGYSGNACSVFVRSTHADERTSASAASSDNSSGGCSQSSSYTMAGYYAKPQHEEGDCTRLCRVAILQDGLRPPCLGRAVEKLDKQPRSEAGSRRPGLRTQHDLDPHQGDGLHWGGSPVESCRALDRGRRH